MLCPICNIDLALSEKQGIEIDYCPKCRGIWLDRGELEKIIERTTLSESEYKPKEKSYKSSGNYRNDDDYNYNNNYNKNKKKSFLGDLFDF